MSIDRRKFLQQGAITALGYGVVTAIPVELLASIRKKISPNDVIGIGVIGCRGQGWSNLTSMLKIPETQCVAICDIDRNVIDQRKTDLEKINMKPAIYDDYRKLLQDKNVDVVIIATPDHWHCLQMIDACAAGKDVLVEKPLSNSIYETQLMVKAVKRYNKIVQVNQWQRSQQHFQNAINFVQSGKLGKISSAKAWMYRGGTTPLPVVPDGPVPAGVDYDMWLGPAQKRPFNKNRFHYEFRWFWDYAGGLMTDWGVHLIDMILLGMKAEIPRSIVAAGGKYIFPGDARETPDLQTAIYDYGNFQMSWEHNMALGSGLYGMQHGMAFIGENGTLLLSRSGWEVRPDKQGDQLKMEAVAWQASSDRGLDKHTVNFIEVVKSRKKELLNCPVEAGARVAINAHMGNIAHRSGEKIFWNPFLNKFNSAKADQLVKPVYYNGWKLPSV
ncbi:MAG TPA: Gfo/Idh/MocA family oxidoreductase [Chitinophagaceae bacterium]|jgi:predicted dehydrogenase|nr:Gfo/Idh/MocA family oxidoreductase [Chitinophagaceae bacterium]